MTAISPRLGRMLPLLLGVVLAAGPDRALSQTGFPQAFEHEVPRVINGQGDDGGQQGEATSRGWSLQVQGLTDEMPAGLDRSDFEQILQQNFFATHAMYERLGPEDRERVYRGYTEKGDIDSVRQDVMRRSRLRNRLPTD